MFPSTQFQIDFGELTSSSCFYPFSNFTFYHSGHEYHINDLCAASFCRKVFELITEDGLTNDYHVKCIDGPFEDIISFIQGKKITIHENHTRFYFDVANELKMPELFEMITKEIRITSYGEFLQILTHSIENGLNCDHFVRKYSDLFLKAVENDAIKSTDAIVVDILLKHHRSAIDTKKLLSLLNHYFKLNINPNHRLVKYYPFGEINEQVSITLLNNININRIINQFPSFKGVSSSLIAENKSPIHTKGWLSCIMDYNIQYSSIDPGSDSPLAITKPYGVFFTKEEKEPFILFDFIQVPISISGYYIKSGFFENGFSPKKAIIEVSLNNQEWHVADEREFDIKDIAEGCCYPVRKGLGVFLFIRIKQIEGYPKANSPLSIVEFEIYE